MNYEIKGVFVWHVQYVLIWPSGEQTLRITLRPDEKSAASYAQKLLDRNRGNKLKVFPAAIQITGPHEHAVLKTVPAMPVVSKKTNLQARLIAAAPDLLEACKVALLMVEGPSGFVPNWDLLRAAIKKAESEALRASVRQT